MRGNRLKNPNLPVAGGSPATECISQAHAFAELLVIQKDFPPRAPAIVYKKVGELFVLKRIVILATACLLLATPPSRAVLIDSGDGSENTKAPASDPGWANIGVGNGLTVTYLGGGWILSAAHVGEINVAIGGTVYPPIPGSRVVLEQSPGVESDLEVFRVDPYPVALPTIPIRDAPITVGTLAIMVGNGRNRGAAIAWRNPPTLDGYEWGAGKSLRWGTNVVSSIELDVVAFGKTTRSFNTTFTQSGSASEAHATVGDSGGPVFTLQETGWEIAGVIWATHTFAEQPANTSVYGNVTLAADLSFYRTQILDIITPLCGNRHLTPDEDCDDGNTADGDCCSSTCSFEAIGSSCDDGLSCETGDQCDEAGVCTPGATRTCDDADPCTEDTCTEPSSCENVFAPGPSCPAAVPAASAAGRASLRFGLGSVRVHFTNPHLRAATSFLG